MAKKDNKRTKKYNKHKFNNDILSNRFNNTFEELYFVGDEFHKPIAFNTHHLRYRIEPKVAVQLETKFIEKVITTNLNWKMLLVIFVKEGNSNEVSTITTVINTTETNMVEFCNYVKANLRLVIENALKANTVPLNAYLTYAYTISYIDMVEEQLADSLADKALAINLLEDVGKLTPFTFEDKDLIKAILTSNHRGIIHDTDKLDNLDNLTINRASNYVPVN